MYRGGALPPNSLYSIYTAQGTQCNTLTTLYASYLSYKAVFQVNNGRSTRFWDDIWKGNIPLRLAYPKLYDLSNNKSGLVKDFFVNGQCHLTFRRTLSPQDVDIWEELMDQLEGSCLNSQQDSVRWALENSGQFSSSSLYKWLSHRGY